MSWNPRRFAHIVNEIADISPEQTLLWLSTDSVNRILPEPSLDWRYIDWSVIPPYPRAGFVVGLGRPVDVKGGDASIFSYDHECVVRVHSRNGEELDYGEDPDLESPNVTKFIQRSWMLYTEPGEVEAAAKTINRETVTVGKKRKSRRQEIVVVDIRRRVIENDEPTDPEAEPVEPPERPTVEHDFRWPVRGHTRMQAYGPGRSLRKKIYIDAYVAGPEDKPIKTRTRVSVVG